MYFHAGQFTDSILLMAKPTPSGYPKAVCCFLPLPARAAKKLVKWANLPWDEKVEQAAKADCEACCLSWSRCTSSERDCFRQCARSVLAVLGFSAPKEEGK